MNADNSEKPSSKDNLDTQDNPAAKKSRTEEKEDGEGNWSATFTLPDPLPAYDWEPNADPNPAEHSHKVEMLLSRNAFIDKSASLYQLFQPHFDESIGDFNSVPLALVYPRRFAKTTLLGFIKAVVSPLPEHGGYPSKKIKEKIASLERGPDHLSFGMHPVVFLDMQSAANVSDLNCGIRRGFKQAGLSPIPDLGDLSPASLVIEYADLLNEQFKRETGKQSRTILLVDEYDKPFRKRNQDEAFLDALKNLYSISKDMSTGISLMVLCGLTRMVGAGLSVLHNLVDVSQCTRYHGICGISARELILCAGDKLDESARKNYDGKDFKEILEAKFRLLWNGFRFGLDTVTGDLNPEDTSGALFSPLDAWELIQSLVVDNSRDPSSKWMLSMQSEFEFASFADKFTSSESATFDLMRNLMGGWETADVLGKKMLREHYLTLGSDIHVKKVLFELGLLSVQAVEKDMVLLGSPNWTVTEHAMMMLVQKVGRVETTEAQAADFLTKKGMEAILETAAKRVDSLYGNTGSTVVREYPFQDHTYFELLLRFPPKEAGAKYTLFREVSVLQGFVQHCSTIAHLVLTETSALGFCEAVFGVGKEARV